MELIFNTKTTRGKVTKNARVLSGDASKPVINISFTAFIVPPSDTASQLTFSPAVLDFSGDTTKYTVIVENRAKAPIHLQMTNLPYEDVKAKIKDETIKGGKTGKLEFAWNEKMPEYNINHALTFIAQRPDTTIKFSVPYSIRGEKGVKPPPPKPVVQQQTIQPGTANKPAQKPQVATQKGMKSISKYPMPQMPAAVSDSPAKPAKADSTKVNPDLPATQWPPP